MNTTIEAVLYTSKTLSNGQHPIMLRLTKNRKRKYISLHISLALQYWDAEKCKPRRNCPDKERIEALIQQKTQELQSQVMDFKTSDKEYTLNTLVEKASRKVVRQTVGEYLNGYIDRLLAEKRVGNAKTFQELRTSLTKFCRSLDFYFLDIDVEWLKRYEQGLRVERHYSDNSIGIRFRSLRVLYNSAITDGLIKKTDYPFDTFKVSRFKEATAKRSLTKEDIRRIMDCEVRTLTKYPKPFLQLAKDLFLFSYLSCGINLTDILHIRYADIVDGRLVFNRQKTGKLLSFQLQPAALDMSAADDDVHIAALQRLLDLRALQMVLHFVGVGAALKEHRAVRADVRDAQLVAREVGEAAAALIRFLDKRRLLAHRLLLRRHVGTGGAGHHGAEP